ncbi:MAG: hypothetical protein NTX45_19040 [Proteobacteria bacterium]|nr:hypothetical protein [Pseudomonadota bacterium]
MISGIRVLDTILSSDKNGDSVTRNSADFWRPFCSASGWKFNFERLHSLADVKYFFSIPIKENVIIFSGHGDETDGFYLSNGDKIDGNNNFKINQKNHGKIIIFSSCLIGKREELANGIKRFFGAKHLFAYQHIMEDRFCFLNESILLTMIDRKFENGQQKFTDNNFIDFTLETDFMKNMNKKGVKNHPLVMF